MEIIKKTFDDLTKDEIDIFIQTYPYKTQKEMEYMTQLEKGEIDKLKEVVENERGITLTKNKKFVKPSENPILGRNSVTSLSIIANALPENERQEVFELSRNLPDAITLVNELIPAQVKRVQMGIIAEISSGRGNNMHTENAVGNYIQLLRTKHEMENGQEVRVEHSFASAIEKAIEREKEQEETKAKKKQKEDIIIEAEVKPKNETDKLKEIIKNKKKKEGLEL